MIPASRSVALLLALLALPSPGLAHRLDEYLQATLVSIKPGEVRLRLNLTPGVEVAEQVISRIDRNKDGVISSNEAAIYSRLLKRDLTLRVDHRKVELRITGLNLPEPTELRTGLGIIQIEFSATVHPLAPGAHSLTLKNRHLSGISVYLFNAAQPPPGSVHIISQKRNDNQSTGEIEFRID
ncbi:MAG TPA: hypothetical protein VL793_09755 [Patescibacteria group bacterium]|nr:hypothetical protein [Patescibacteria group bacterium]